MTIDRDSVSGHQGGIGNNIQMIYKKNSPRELQMYNEGHNDFTYPVHLHIQKTERSHKNDSKT